MDDEFPDDDNGTVLRQMRRDGDKLEKPREIDFNAIFPTKAKALQLAKTFRDLGYLVVVRKTKVDDDLPWDVTIRKFMIPTHYGITSFESAVQKASAMHGGRADGWGCFERSDQDH